jgi:hypothetical protein
VHHFLRISAKNDARPLKVLLAMSASRTIKLKA